MIEKIDHYLGLICCKPLHLVRSATGLDNFFWTYTLLISNVILLVYGATTITDNALRLLAICLIGTEFMDISFVSSIQQATRRGDSVLPSNPLTSQSTQNWRVFNAFMAILALLSTIPIFFTISWTCNLIAMYWAVDIQPPRKSWARRAVDWLKAHRPHLAPAHPPALPIPG